MYDHMDDLTEGYKFRCIDYLYNINRIDPIILFKFPL